MKIEKDSDLDEYLPDLLNDFTALRLEPQKTGNDKLRKDIAPVIKEIAKRMKLVVREKEKSNVKDIKYTVYVDGNFHYQDEEERYTLGVFETEEEAIYAAKKIVGEFLLSH